VCVCAVSLENIAVDISELEKGISATRSELEAARGCRASVSVLEEFLANAEHQMNTLNTDCKKAQVNESVILVAVCQYSLHSFLGLRPVLVCCCPRPYLSQVPLLFWGLHNFVWLLNHLSAKLNHLTDDLHIVQLMPLPPLHLLLH